MGTRLRLFYACSPTTAVETAGARGGQEALLFLEQRVPDVVVLDHRMPDVNGLEVLERMRADPRLAAVPVLLFSADGYALAADAAGKGAAEVVTKGTVGWPELRAKIVRLAAATKSE